MRERPQKFVGRNATMVVGRDGVTFVRSPLQARKSGMPRTTKVSYGELGDVSLRRAALRPGQLEFKRKTGSRGVTSLNRTNRVQFDRQSAHKFRRAARQVSRKIESYTQQANPSTPPDLFSSESPSPAQGIRYRLPQNKA